MKEKEIVKLLNNNKEYIFKFHKKFSPFFPGCCSDVAAMLHHFILQYYGVDFEIIIATKKVYPNNTAYHMWLESNNHIIDFTYFQFYVGKNKFKKVDDDTAYRYCIEEIQRGDVIFDKQFYKKIFTDIEPANRNRLYGNFLDDLRILPVNTNISADLSLKDFYERCKPFIKLR